ncbi:MAG: hypothetical protein J0M07_12085 [Anaerolineae bacterium]|nr:hypothetical protein [Anaerolineae bacterium]
MSRTLSLNGSDWQFKAFEGEDWRWRDAHKPQTTDIRHWHTGSVPGSVHHDLWQVGAVPNPYFERNSLLLEWIPARTWLYKKTFRVGDELRGQRMRLCFMGVDYEAQFFLNGELLGTHVGMFTPAQFDVSDRLLYGQDNLIAVVIEPAPHEQPQVGRTSLVRTHKSRMTYWWDFCPRMIHVGIWDDVWLEATGDARIDSVFVRPQLNADFTHADVVISLELDALAARAARVETTLRYQGKVVANGHADLALAEGRTPFTQFLPIDQPRLWWPNGHGDQPLYEAEITLSEPDSAMLDQRTVRFGVRRVELVRNDTADLSARPYTLQVNGVKMFAKGWNWVPMDVLFGVPRPDKLEHLLTLIQYAHVNLLRVWGGGLIETEAFYNRCDELGIMVWQEFIQSSSGIENTPATDPEFVEFIISEAEQIIPHKRNHPSLVIWCGGNELTTADNTPLDARHPLLGALGATVARLDPDRVWLPTSPTGRVFMNSLENIVRDPTSLHDVHGPWEYQGVRGQYELYNHSTSLLHSEFGVEGVTNLATLDRTIAPEHQQPPTLDNPYWQHLGAWWNQTRTWTATWGEIADVPTLVRATQFTQAEGLRYAIEADQRRKYQNSGTLPWQFNEPYPNATCTAAVDYYGIAKPAYYAVARAYAPIHVSARFATMAWGKSSTFSAQVWVNNAYERAYAEVELRVRLHSVRGTVIHEWVSSVAWTANSAQQIFALAHPLVDVTEVFFLDLRLTDSDGSVIAQNRYPFTRSDTLAPLLNLPSTGVYMQQTDVNGMATLTLANSGEAVAFGLWLEDEVGSHYTQFSDNYLYLLPGETATITARCSDGTRPVIRITTGIAQ